MNFQNILNEIEKMDPEVYERTSERRHVIKVWGRNLALAAVPFALGSLFNKAYGKGASAITDVLNFALTLEYLEAEFYTKAVAMSGSIGIPDGAEYNAFVTIRDHENAHVNFLKTAINGAGGTPVDKPDFDFTAGGAFANVFSNYDTFLAVSQTFEDTGVRAYKGQAGNLISDNAVLTAALQIHSVEARHASHVRHIRKMRGAPVKQWITGKDTGGIGSAVAASYAGEQNTNQLGVEIVNINGKSINANAASESFDEPLSKEQVLNIVSPFIVA